MEYMTLKEVRNSLPLKFNQEQFGRLLGVSKPTIARWESGRGKMNRCYYAIICFEPTEGGTFKGKFKLTMRTLNYLFRLKKNLNK